MSNSPSTLTVLLESLRADPTGPQVRSQIYFKSSLTALSHAMEDQAMASNDQPLIIATFQQERFYRQEAHRYERIAAQSQQVYVMAAPETEFSNASGVYETVAFLPTDSLTQEWNLVVIGESYASCLVCEERQVKPSTAQHVDPSRRFEGIWTFERSVSIQAANFLLGRILHYRPELTDKVRLAQAHLAKTPENAASLATPGPFAERLVTYLQAGQYKLLKAYRAIAEKERRESLVNSIATAVRQSLDPEAVFQMTVQELGEAMAACRCLIYPCRADDSSVTLHHEYLGRDDVPSLAGQSLALKNHRLFQEALLQETPIYLEQVAGDPRLTQSERLRHWAQQGEIERWLMVPLLHQGELLGIVELHRCHGASTELLPWSDADLALVEAIAPQISVAFIQARAYADLANLNQQLAALEQTRYNLTAIVGHELRTPLATVKICLESLASEPDMPLEVRQVMLNTALGDAERLRHLVQDFLTLSRLESGRIQLQTEALSIQECVSLALSNINARRAKMPLPEVRNEIADDLPWIEGDGERLVEVLAKLLDNACKFTEPDGEVTIRAKAYDSKTLEVTIADNGRGIAPDRLEAIFERFYQEEGALRRTTSGTGLGLAICRQIINRLGGGIWAESAGLNQGTQFRFTLPIAQMGLSGTSGR